MNPFVCVKTRFFLLAFIFASKPYNTSHKNLSLSREDFSFNTRIELFSLPNACSSSPFAAFDTPFTVNIFVFTHTHTSLSSFTVYFFWSYANVCDRVVLLTTIIWLWPFFPPFRIAILDFLLFDYIPPSLACLCLQRIENDLALFHIYFIFVC